MLLRPLLVSLLPLLLPLLLSALVSAAGVQRVNSRSRNLDDGNYVEEARVPSEGEQPKWRADSRFRNLEDGSDVEESEGDDPKWTVNSRLRKLEDGNDAGVVKWRVNDRIHTLDDGNYIHEARLQSEGEGPKSRVNSRFRKLDDGNDAGVVSEGEEPKWRVNHRFLKFDTESDGRSSLLNTSALADAVVRRVKELTAGGVRAKRSDEDDEDGDGEGLTTKHLNDIVDFVLEVLRDHVLENGLDRAALPDVAETFERRVLAATLRGSFRGRGGWVRRLSTLTRTGDVRGRRHGPGVLSLSAALGLRELSAGFQEYEARVQGLAALAGSLSADVGANSVRLNVSFWARPGGARCQVQLRELTVERLDDVNVRATGLSPFNWLLSRVATWVVRRQRDNIGRAIERLVGAALAGDLPESVPCDADFINAFSFA